VAYLGGVDGDERVMLNTLIAHFATKLNDERGRNADLVRQMECLRERIALLEAAAYGLF
jgi:hypothetical protein